LLLLAECLVGRKKAAEALPYLNRVRERAGPTDPSQAASDHIANERHHELAFENRQCTDRIRNGTALAKRTVKGVRLKAKFGWLLPQSFHVTKDRFIYPIPAREIQINPN
jgi:hypothetical protein